MSQNHIFDIFRKPKFDETIQKVETRTYYPYVKSFNNNDVIEISINQGDSWLMMHEAALVIEGVLTRKSGAGEVNLVNNAGAFLFDMISYDLNGKEIDSVREPGIVSTIKGYLCYSPHDSKHLDIAGWNYPSIPIVNASDGLFVMRIPLHHLLNIFNDYQLAHFGKQTLRLVRARNDNDCVKIKEVVNPTAATKWELKINNISLKVQVVFPNDLLKMNLLESIKADSPIIIPFRKWEYHELPQLTHGATKEIWAVKTCLAVESPRYIIIAFQTNRRGLDVKDPTYFDHINTSDIRILLNGECYPQERMRLDFDKNHYSEAHYNYTQFYSSFKNDMTQLKQPLLEYTEYKNRSVFVTDCSRRNDSLKSSTVDIKIDIESTKGFPTHTRAYCIIIHDCIMEHLPLSEIVRNLS